MLKSKECYANERIYATNYFFHKAEVKDYCIDPMLGSFVRVVYPPKDMPEGGAEMYYKPQFMFMTREHRSPLYDLKAAGLLHRQVMKVCEMESIGYARIPMTIDGKLEIDNHGTVMFKDTDLRYQRLVSPPPRPNFDRGPNNTLLTHTRYREVLDLLQYALECAAAGAGDTKEITVLEREVMTTLHRPDSKVVQPVVITARKFSERKDSYVILHSNNQRLVIPTELAEDMAERYFNNITQCAEDLLGRGKVGDGEVKFVYAKPGVIDENMEYTNVRVVDFESGKQVHVTMNSDRFPGNTKFSFIYDAKFVQELKTRIIVVARQLQQLDA